MAVNTKMKKLLLTLLLVGLFTLDISAEEYSSQTDITLTYNVEPTYSVKIPKSLDISNNETVLNYYVSGDIYADQKLQVLFDSQTEIKNALDSCVLTISQEKSIWTQNELSKTYVSCAAHITHSKLKSGTYIGTLNVSISLLGGTQWI